MDPMDEMDNMDTTKRLGVSVDAGALNVRSAHAPIH